MTIAVILYILGFVFHTWCADLELSDCRRNGLTITLFAYVRVFVMLVFWPVVPIQILIESYRMRINALL